MRDNGTFAYTIIVKRNYYLPEDVDSSITKVKDRRNEAKDDEWMQSIHESIDQLSEIIDSMPKDRLALQNEDGYLCDKETAYMLKVSRRTLSKSRKYVEIRTVANSLPRS